MLSERCKGGQDLILFSYILFWKDSCPRALRGSDSTAHLPGGTPWLRTLFQPLETINPCRSDATAGLVSSFPQPFPAMGPYPFLSSAHPQEYTPFLGLGLSPMPQLPCSWPGWWDRLYLASLVGPPIAPALREQLAHAGL